MTKEKALALYLDVDENEIEENTWGTYGIKGDGGEYLVLTDEEADEEAKKEIKESLWAFNASFILNECNMENHNKVEKSLIAMQKACFLIAKGVISLETKLCKSSNISGAFDISNALAFVFS